MMPGARRVLVEVAPFPASTGAGYLGAAERACLLAGVAGCRGKRDISHLRGPLRCRLAARRGEAGVLAVGGGRPGSGIQSRYQPTPCVDDALLAAGPPAAGPGPGHDGSP